MMPTPFRRCLVCVMLLTSGRVFANDTASVSPASFVADNGTTGTIKVCLLDATSHGISGIHFNWANYSGGMVTIGGSASSPIPTATGSNGCVQTTIAANSVPPNQSTDYILFSAPHPYESTPAATLTLTAHWALQAMPASIPASGTSAVTLTLRSYGVAQPGVLIVASCSISGTAGVSVATAAVATNDAGLAVFSLTPTGTYQPSTSVTCSFSTPYADAVTPAQVTVVAPAATPDHLAFGLQPVDMPQGARLDSVIVEILKSGSNALDTADSTTQITLTTTVSICGQAVTFGPVTAVKGSADFTNVGPRFYALTSAPLRLAATSSPALAGATSNTFNVVPDPADFIFAGGMESCSL